MSRLDQHHEEIVRFLKTIKDKTTKLDSISYGSDEEKLLTHMLKHQDIKFRRPTYIADKLDTKTPILSKRIRESLNRELKLFSGDPEISITPPIRLYFSTPGRYPGGHFACCKLEEKETKSDRFITVEDLQNQIKKACRILGLQRHLSKDVSSIIPSVKSEDRPLATSSPSPFRTIQERLEKQLGRYPCLEDITEGGSYYRNEVYHENIKDKLLRNRKCLILATPGCGKTSLAVALGHEFSQDGYSVYYHDATTESDSTQWESFISSCDENTLVILDNAHAKVEEINTLISTFDKYKPMLLMTAREVPPDITYSQPSNSTHDISYLEFFQKEEEQQKIKIDIKTIRNIINWYVVNKELLTNKIGSIKSIIKKCEGDYNILRFHIEAWQRKGYAGTLSGLEEIDILDHVYLHYLRDCPYRQELLRISALTQLEIDVDLRWIGRRPADELQTEGIVLSSKETIEPGRYVSWLRIYHPTVAEYFLKAAAYNHSLESNSVDEFTLRCVKDYLSTAPVNGLTVFLRLGWMCRQESYWFYSWPLDSDMYRAYSDIALQESPYPHLSEERIVQDVLLPLVPYIDEMDFEVFRHTIIDVIFRLIKTLEIDISSLLPKVDFRQLGRKVQKTHARWMGVSCFIGNALDATIPSEKIVAFCEQMDFEELGKEVSEAIEAAGWMEIYAFIECIQAARIPDEKVFAFYDGVDFQLLGLRAQLDKECLLFVERVNDPDSSPIFPSERIVEFWRGVRFQYLGKEAQEDGWWALGFPASFIELFQEAEVPHERIVEFCEGINFGDLGKQARKDKVCRQDISNFIDGARQIGVPECKIAKFSQAIDCDDCC